MTRLTLSFDNGPDPEATPWVLDTLREHGLRAYFFVLGKHLEDVARRRLVERAVSDGHLVGNHTFSHRIPLGNDGRIDAVEAEIVATETLLAPLVTGPKRFRPFAGGGALGPHLLSARAADYLIAHAYTCMLWNSVPRDWQDPDGWLERALADCAAERHTVLVLHDVRNACSAKLEDFLGQVRDLEIEVVLDVPLPCTPIREGKIVGDLQAFVSTPMS